jgi:glycosyltransferase involved in cell wall biosynthesis
VQPAHGSFPELIEATGGGLLIKPNDPDDLARGLVRLLTDSGLRREMGGKGREAVQSRLTAEQEARRTAEHFQHIRQHR